MGLDSMAEEVFDIADDSTNDWVERQRNGKTVTEVDAEHIARSRLRFDARRWYLSKLAPKRYGEKLEATLRGDAEAPIKLTVEDGQL
jgi:hypothetical protein